MITTRGREMLALAQRATWTKKEILGVRRGGEYGLALDGDGLHQRGKDGERRFVGRNRERAEGRDGGRERERRGPNGRLGRSGQLKKDEEIGLCRRRRDSTERAGVPQTGRRLSGMRDPSPRLPSPGRSPRRPSTPLPPTTTDPRGFPSFSTLRAPTDNTPLHHYQSRHTIETANC